MEKKTRKKTAKKTTAAKPKKKAVAVREAVAAATRKKSAFASKPCKVGGCKREYRAKGYCASHYRQWRHGKFGKARYTSCSDYGCTKPMADNRMGYCEEHYQNYYVKGMEKTHAPAPAAKPAAEEKVA